MKKEHLLTILILSIYHSILFFGNEWGLQVLMFIIPLLLFIYNIFNKNNVVKNKKGYLFIIPILILSTTYLIFDNSLFRMLNFLVIPILFIMMYIYLTNKQINLNNLITKFFAFVFEPLNYISELFQKITKSINIKINDKAKKIIKSIIIILPITLIIILLLSSADAIFNNIFSSLFINIKKIFEFSTFTNILLRIILIAMIFIYFSVLMYFILEKNKEEKIEIKRIEKDQTTFKLLLIVLNVVYVIFDIIQIKSLIFHSTGNINYASYARQGFFQLMVVSVINFTIILIAKYFSKDKSNDTKKINWLSVIMLGLTFIIIISSALRMHLYENQYGYTLLRLLVYTILITEALLIIPTIKYIFNSKFKVLNYYIAIMITMYCLLNIVNVDYIIAKRNIKRYDIKQDIDLEYLENYNFDNIPLLVEFYKQAEDKEVKNNLKEYLDSLEMPKRNILEYNVSVSRAKDLLKDNRK